MSENNLTHFDAAGNAVMVDVSEKPVTAREATAHGIITMNADAFAAVESGTVKKGDVLGVARVAGHGAGRDPSGGKDRRQERTLHPGGGRLCLIPRAAISIISAFP